jgi:hypothetical protein
VPYAFITPLAQTALAVFALSWMVRRLTHPLATPSSKLHTYLALFVLDLFWAGLVYDLVKTGQGLTEPAVRFAIGHTILSFLLMTRCTPGQNSYLSWVWRLRGRRALWLDLLLGERTLNTLVLVAYCVIGAAVFAGAIMLPATLMNPGVHAATVWPAVHISALFGVLLILCYGLFYQTFAVVVEKGAGFVFLLSGSVIMLAPYVMGEYYDRPLLSSLSPIGVFVRLVQDPRAAYAPAPGALLHGVFIAFWGLLLWRITRQIGHRVSRKLQAMGIDGAAHRAP